MINWAFNQCIQNQVIISTSYQRNKWSTLSDQTTNNEDYAIKQTCVQYVHINWIVLLTVTSIIYLSASKLLWLVNWSLLWFHPCIAWSLDVLLIWTTWPLQLSSLNQIICLQDWLIYLLLKPDLLNTWLLESI